GAVDLQATQEFRKFDSIEQVSEFLAMHSSPATNYARGGIATGGLMMEDAMAAPMVKSEGAGMAYDGGGGATDVSSTNVQVEGVDEADIVKNDDKYIYMIADNKLVIVDAYPPERADIVSQTKISGTDDYYGGIRGKELYILGDRLVLFAETNEQAFYFEKYDILPRQTWRAKTLVYIYDVSDHAHPKMEDQISLTGSYFESRMIDGIVYLVTQEGVMNGIRINEPMIAQDAKVIMPPIYYFDNPDQDYNFNTIASIDVKKGEVIDSKTFMLGYANTVMVSQDNIYIAYARQYWWRPWWSQDAGYDKARFYDVVLPLLTGDLKADIDAIIAKHLSDDEEWRQIAQRFGDFYQGVQQDKVEQKYEDMFSDIQDALTEYDTKKALEQAKTVIHRFSIDAGVIEHQADGEVQGTLLNQYSMDEFEGNLRVATSVNVWAGRSVMHNDVYVLDSEMDVVGEASGIAPDERIYSTRFVGKRLYMVTFRQVDPFFVIDLSDPKDPRILGALKIPGYSDYLHPYDENHVIGIGKATEATDWGFTTGGVKVALFDVTDPTNPEQVDSWEIGDQGSDSPALHDPHAFLFSKERNLLVLPIAQVERIDKYDQYRYRYTTWHGAYVFRVDENGFTLLGKVKHSGSTNDYFNWWDQASVFRSLYMDDALYTISNKYIKMNDLGDGLDAIGTIDLPFEQQYQYYMG
ncbi:MAG: beta-propeller domain-containing protein, partial [Nanoarchaeota archaeon]